MGRAYEVRKFKMEKSSQAKTKVYSKYGRELYMAAKQGQDPSMNSELQRVIEKAKKDQVPNDIIERAIKKATQNNTEHYDSITYEGFGPGGSNLIISALSDNSNRTYSEIRTCFNKAHAKLGVSGSVIHQFSHISLFLVKGITDEEALEVLLESDIEPKDINLDGDLLEIQGEVSDYGKIMKALKDCGKKIEFVTNEITYIPTNTVELQGEDLEVFQKLYNLLDELDDVQDVYHNVK